MARPPVVRKSLRDWPVSDYEPKRKYNSREGRVLTYRPVRRRNKRLVRSGDADRVDRFRHPWGIWDHPHW